MNSGLNGLPSHFSKIANVVSGLLSVSGTASGGQTQATAANPVLLTGPGTATGSDAPVAVGITPTWNTSGNPIALKVNSTVIASGNVGLLLQLQRNGILEFSVDEFGTTLCAGPLSCGSVSVAPIRLGGSVIGAATVQATGTFGWSSNTNVALTPDLGLTRAAAATLQQGAADVAAPVAQTTQVQSVVAGTTDTAGADWALVASKGTGTAASGNIIDKTGVSAKSTGTSQHTTVDRKILVGKGKVLTSAAAFAMFDVALPTLSMCGGVIEATIVCTDGTDMQSFTQTVTYSAVNKGGVYTTSITASTGDKSVSAGTLTTAWTIVGGTNKVTIKVTPTTSLTPSTNAFLLYYTIKNNSEQATTIL